jgi:hypothetical protein
MERDPGVLKRVVVANERVSTRWSTSSHGKSVQTPSCVGDGEMEPDGGHLLHPRKTEGTAHGMGFGKIRVILMREQPIHRLVAVIQLS